MESSTINQTKILLNISENYSNDKNHSLIMEEQMDKFKLLWLYHLFVSYLRPMLTLSNFAVFASVLMILLATTERLLLTFEGKQIKKARKILERNRRQVTLFVISIAFAYKLCTYFEIELIENKDCEGFEQFEVISAVHAYNPNPLFRLFGADKYRFWMMFVIRNLNINKIEDQTQKKNLRAATRALISVVSMYLMSKVLQVAVTFFETFSPERLTEEEFRPIYSYANDIIPILTLLSSTLRFPIYCVCNKPMLIATRVSSIYILI
uniref:G_PROTEIN_RECEP_F1_2 domain-containing protein n=1 Tax=Meloidogyne javanica TaxID=6303 RepID=A0A915MJH4_MELJA